MAFLLNFMLRIGFSEGYSIPRGTMICLVMAIIFFIRWMRFRDKKVNYTVLWFVKKYKNSKWDALHNL